MTKLRTTLLLGLLGMAACSGAANETKEPVPKPETLQGSWEDTLGENRSRLEIQGASLYFYDRPDFQYDTTFQLTPGTNPMEFQATILDSPRTTDSDGEVVTAIYAFEEGLLKVAVVSKEEGKTPSFEDSISQYLFRRP